MEYKFQLTRPEWINKRKEILKRDSNRCTKCFNKNYQEIFNSGLILKSDINYINNLPFVKVKIWNFKQNKIDVSLISNEHINTSKNYIAFYESNGKSNNITALKNISDKMVETSNNLIDLVKLGLRGKVTENTFDNIYAEVSQKDSWYFVKGLHIHHKFYQEGKLAWQYDSTDLTTLCWECHKNLHENEKIKVFDENGNNISNYTNCNRCYGAGYFPEFYHVKSGICFRCDGNRFEELMIQ